MVPADFSGQKDGLIDDLVSTGHLQKFCECLGGATLIALYTFGSPFDSKEPTSRDGLIEINELLSEGSLEEIEIVLGWKVDSRRLALILPQGQV